jgi:hypothetical protein
MIRKFAKLVSLLTLIILILPSFLYLSDKMALNKVKLIMGLCTIFWFFFATIWMWAENEGAEDSGNSEDKGFGRH